MIDVYLEKSEESLNAAKSCFELEYYNSCINRAYYAMFQAAVAALFRSGFRPKSEKSVMIGFKLNFQKRLFWETNAFHT